MLQRNVTVIFLSAVISLLCYQEATRSRYAQVFAEALGHISRFYVEPVDKRDLFEGAMQGMVERLDQYSVYVTPREYAQLQEGLEQEFGGVGIVVELNPETNRLTVLSPLVGTPAYKAGMRAGDVVLEIDGESTEGFSLEDAVRRMRGRPGTPVQLTIQHQGEEQTRALTIIRDKIKVESALGDTRNADGSWNFALADNPRIGYVRLTTFGDQTAEELRAALQSVSGSIDGLILDLRGNAGGLLTAAIATCDMLIDEGVIVSTRARSARNSQEYSAEPENTILDRQLPVVVLVNRYAASASEIVAACLQDHQRAVVVGQRTWGKGTVQNVLPLEAGTSALKLTTASYWRPSEKNIHRGKDATEEDDWGVRPNEGYEVILSDEEFERTMRERRNRDILQLDDAGSPEPPADGEVPNEGADQPVIDRQLQRAVQYIKETLARRQKAA